MATYAGTTASAYATSVASTKYRPRRQGTTASAYSFGSSTVSSNYASIPASACASRVARAASGVAVGDPSPFASEVVT